MPVPSKVLPERVRNSSFGSQAAMPLGSLGPGAVLVAQGMPVDALGGEEGVVLLEGLPEDVKGGERILGGGTRAGVGQLRDPAQVPVADGAVHPHGRAVAASSGAHSEDGAVGCGVGPGAGPLCGVALEAADGGGLVLLEGSVPDGEHGAVAVRAPDSVGGRLVGGGGRGGLADEGQCDGGGRDNAHDLAFSVGDLLGAAPRSPTPRSPGHPAVRSVDGGASPRHRRCPGVTAFSPCTSPPGIRAPVSCCPP